MENLTLAKTANKELTGRDGLDLETLFVKYAAFIDVRPKSLDTYRKAIKNFLGYVAARGIREPSRLDIIAYKEFLEAEGKKPTTGRLYLAAVKGFFAWLEQEGLYRNIAAKVKGAKIEKGFKKDYLTTNQARGLLESMKRETPEEKRDFAIVLLSITTGLRTVEISRANIEDIRPAGDFTALYIQGKGKDEKADFVKLAPKTEAAIFDYLTTRRGAVGESPLFAGIGNRNRGGRLSTRIISKLEKEALKGAGLVSSRLTAHSLRHTAATLNLQNGGTLEETKQLLRHANINTTLIYSHALERASNKSEMRIEGALGI
ncbi:MAG: tyrosine-type recombinase/integrase [Fibrobacter sp.]|nr:tyrosine-type recombinase/integrase [Fibrobacter sp.]